MKTLTIITRRVYHKVAEVKIEIPDDVEAIDDYLRDDGEHLWVEKLGEAVENAELEFGNGMEDGDWTDSNEDSETRYEYTQGDRVIGGHV